jgi:hypothetical protein
MMEGSNSLRLSSSARSRYLGAKQSTASAPLSPNELNYLYNSQTTITSPVMMNELSTPPSQLFDTSMLHDDDDEYDKKNEHEREQEYKHAALEESSKLIKTNGQEAVDDEEISPVVEQTMVELRMSGRNIVSTDKKTLKKEWQFIYSQTCTLLGRSGVKSAANITASLSAKSQQGSLVEAMKLLTTAALVPVYVNAPGEAFAETYRSALGELLLVRILHDSSV